MVNIYRKAYEIVTSKTSDKMSAKEIKLVGTASTFMAGILPRLKHQYDNLPISKGLLRLAQIIEGGNDGNKSR